MQDSTQLPKSSSFIGSSVSCLKIYILHPRPSEQTNLPLFIQSDLLLRLPPDFLNQLGMFRRPHTDIALKGCRNCHPARNHRASRIDRLAIDNLLRDVEAPDNPTNVQIQRFLCNVHTGTHSSACSVGEVISLIGVCNVEVGCGRKVITQVALWFEFEWRFISCRVVIDVPEIVQPCYASGGWINLPPVDENNRTFWDELTFIPIIFRGCVMHPNFIRRSHPQQLLDDGSDVRQVLLIFPSGIPI